MMLMSCKGEENMSQEKKELVEEIKMIMEKALCLNCMDLNELEKLREALEPAVYDWNDEERVGRAHV